MGALESFLSSSDYGYDYVLAVTQDSINATALAFLNARRPVVNVCYVYDDNGDPQQIEYSALREKASGADPFNIPDAGPDRETAVTSLDTAGFMFGFSAAMGVPEGYRPDALPDVVTLGATATDPVMYRLLCRNILLVELKQIPHKKPVLQVFAQPKGPGGSPWIFSYKVPLVHRSVDDNVAFLKSAGFVNLPMPVQKKLTDRPEDFTIWQLLYEFNQAAGETRPEIEGVDRVLRETLYEDFSIKYFDQMRAAAPPLVAVLPRGADPTANLKTEFSIDPYPSQPKLATLNYLCAAADHSLPPSKPFAWKWVEPAEAESFDGVCVLNRTELVRHLRSQLSAYFAANQWVPQPFDLEVHPLSYWCAFGVFASRNWHGKKPDKLNTKETKDEPVEGPVLLHWTFESDREYWPSTGNYLHGKTSFEMTVTCKGNVLTVEQRALVYCRLEIHLFDDHEWNLVDLKITDTFTLAIEHDGRLTARRDSKTDDNSTKIGYNWVAPLMQDQFLKVQHEVKSWLSQALVDVPLSLINTVIFPGGRGFFFKDVGFSDHQDLVAHITYADPS